MAEIRHLENRHHVIFFCWGWSDLNKISQTGAEWHVDCGGMVKIETRCRIPIRRTFGRIPWHVIPQPPATLQGAVTGKFNVMIPELCVTLHGAATWWILCHDSRAICHITGCSHLAKSMSWSCHLAGCNNSICHIENRFSPSFIYFCLFVVNAVWALTSGGFRVVSDTLVCNAAVWTFQLLGERNVALGKAKSNQYL